MTPNLRVRDATDGDLRRTAQLHVTALPVGLFPRLGTGFVRRWHLGVLRSAHGVVLVCERTAPTGAPIVVGFLLGATDRAAVNRDLLTRHRGALAGRAVLAMAGRPRTLVYFLRTRLVRYLRRFRTAPATPQPARRVADLGALAVDPDERANGAGRALVAAFLDRSASAGTGSAELVTELDSPAEGFYRGLGWTVLEDVRTRDGTWVRRFAIGLPVRVQR